jgi:hypothetical protein
MALIGNTADTYGQTWHLPCNDNRLTYKQFITEIDGNWDESKIQSFAQGRPKIGSFDHNLKEIQEFTSLCD